MKWTVWDMVAKHHPFHQIDDFTACFPWKFCTIVLDWVTSKLSVLKQELLMCKHFLTMFARSINIDGPLILRIHYHYTFYGTNHNIQQGVSNTWHPSNFKISRKEWQGNEVLFYSVEVSSVFLEKALTTLLLLSFCSGVKYYCYLNRYKIWLFLKISNQNILTHSLKLTPTVGQIYLIYICICILCLR